MRINPLRSVFNFAESVYREVVCHSQREFVDHAMQLLKDMRVEAVKQDSWYNRTTPKEVDAVSSLYVPLMMVASGTTVYEKTNLQYQLAQMMLAELYKTPTAQNLFWDFKTNPIYSCSERYVSPDDRDCRPGVVTECSVGGYRDENSTVTCVSGGYFSI